MAYRASVGSTVFAFADLKDLMAKATPPRSGDRLAGIAAETAVHGDDLVLGDAHRARLARAAVAAARAGEAQAVAIPGELAHGADLNTASGRRGSRPVPASARLRPWDAES